MRTKLYHPNGDYVLIVTKDKNSLDLIKKRSNLRTDSEMRRDGLGKY